VSGKRKRNLFFTNKKVPEANLDTKAVNGVMRALYHSTTKGVLDEVWDITTALTDAPLWLTDENKHHEIRTTVFYTLNIIGYVSFTRWRTRAVQVTANNLEDKGIGHYREKRAQTRPCRGPQFVFDGSAFASATCGLLKTPHILTLQV